MWCIGVPPCNILQHCLDPSGFPLQANLLQQFHVCFQKRHFTFKKVKVHTSTCQSSRQQSSSKPVNFNGNCTSRSTWQQSSELLSQHQTICLFGNQSSEQHQCLNDKPLHFCALFASTCPEALAQHKHFSRELAFHFFHTATMPMSWLTRIIYCITWSRITHWGHGFEWVLTLLRIGFAMICKTMEPWGRCFCCENPLGVELLRDAKVKVGWSHVRFQPREVASQIGWQEFFSRSSSAGCTRGCPTCHRSITATNCARCWSVHILVE